MKIKEHTIIKRNHTQFTELFVNGFGEHDLDKVITPTYLSYCDNDYYIYTDVFT